jgi:glycosyltransferase involved in cell wall biosynthesis
LHQPWRPGDPRIIRYFAGSPSHDRDFDSIVPVLVRFLQEHPSVRLEIVGPVACDWARFPAGRLTLHPPLAHAALPRLLAKSWVNLAPLAPSPFTACKSAIKFLEAGAFQCPTLASPHDDLLRHQEQGAPAILCQTADDWHRQLTALLDDEQRTTHGQSIAGYVDQHGMARASAAIWAHALAQGVS